MDEKLQPHHDPRRLWDLLWTKKRSGGHVASTPIELASRGILTRSRLPGLSFFVEKGPQQYVSTVWQHLAMWYNAVLMTILREYQKEGMKGIPSVGKRLEGGGGVGVSLDVRPVSDVGSG